ncbi:MAG: RND transporter, partial [Marinilabiliales bacterium]
MNKKRLLYIVGVLLIIAVVIYLTVISGSEEAEVVINAPVKYGKFEIVVTTTGELQAENSEKIRGPSGLRRIRVYNVKITDLVAEGTVIDSGDYVATLDRTEAETRLKDIESNLQQIESQYTETRLDTTMEMRNARDELVNLKYSMEEAKI